MSSVVFHAGPSDVMTRNFASGSRSPTLMGMVLFLSLRLNRVLSLAVPPKIRPQGPRAPKLARRAN